MEASSQTVCLDKFEEPQRSQKQHFHWSKSLRLFYFSPSCKKKNDRLIYKKNWPSKFQFGQILRSEILRQFYVISEWKSLDFWNEYVDVSWFHMMKNLIRSRGRFTWFRDRVISRQFCQFNLITTLEAQTKYSHPWSLRVWQLEVWKLEVWKLVKFENSSSLKTRQV